MKTFAKKYNEHWYNRTEDHYFGFHFLWNYLCKNNEKFAKRFRQIPYYDARIPRISTSRFYPDPVILKNKLSVKSQKILDDKKIPMYKFKSSDFKGEIDNLKYIGTNLEYLIKKVNYNVYEERNCDYVYW